MKGKKQLIEEILEKFIMGHPKIQAVDEIYNLFYPPVIDVFKEMNPSFEKAGLKLISAEREAEIWLDANPKIGRLDPIPFLFKTKVFVSLNGSYYGNIVRVEISAEEAMDLKLESIADLLIEKLKRGEFD